MLKKSINTFLFLILFIASFFCKASDSLKVKKTEYYEDGKLVRATFFDSLKYKTKDIYFSYRDYLNESIRSGALIFTYIGSKLNSVSEYNFELNNEGVDLNISPYIGNKQTIKYDTLGRYSEINCELMYLNKSYEKRVCSIDSIEFIKLRYEKGFHLKHFYDKFGNRVLTKNIKNRNKTIYKYDSLNRFVESVSLNESQKNITKITYLNNENLINYQMKDGLRYLENSIKKVILNEKKQEIKIEKYLFPLKDYRVIGEPKLTFTQENIYENDRIVKIIYTDHINNKTKTHELKYEFY